MHTIEYIINYNYIVIVILKNDNKTYFWDSLRVSTGGQGGGGQLLWQLHHSSACWWSSSPFCGCWGLYDMIPFAWGLDSVMSIFASISQAWPPRSQGTLKWYARLNFKPLGHSFVYVLFLKWFLVHLFEQSLILTSNWSSSLHQAQTATNNWDIVPNHDFSMSWVDNDIIFVFPYISLRTIETFEHHLAPILAPHHLRPHSMWHLPRNSRCGCGRHWLCFVRRRLTQFWGWWADSRLILPKKRRGMRDGPGRFGTDPQNWTWDTYDTSPQGAVRDG